MSRSFLGAIALAIFLSPLHAQVKRPYVFHKRMPYGKLDIRTAVNKRNYFYLQEGKTFSYRQNADGSPTDTYRDMTAWDSSPYLEGNLRHRAGKADKFVMNYRLLLPRNYRDNYKTGYPLIVVMHGGGERGNCFYNDCHHADWNYDPVANRPMAPTAADHKLLNNDHHLFIGGQQHLDARNLAGDRLPHARMPSRAFPGFVLFCQMFNEWNPEAVEQMIRIVRLHCEKYAIDQNRIYIHGLSIGGYAVYEAIKRAPWLFAAALPMAANKESSIFKHKLENRVVHIPLWVFQGGRDSNPTPDFTKELVKNFRSSGAIVRYTEYPSLGHAIWNRAYAEPDFFSWMLKQNKSNIHAQKGIKKIDDSKKIYPKLMLADGYHAYQWQRNGRLLKNRGSQLLVKTPGKYRARFSRTPRPAANDWNRWSRVIVVSKVKTRGASQTEPVLIVEESQPSVYPNPTAQHDLQVHYDVTRPVSISLFDAYGRKVYEELFDVQEMPNPAIDVKTPLTDGLYFMVIDDGERQFKERIVIRN